MSVYPSIPDIPAGSWDIALVPIVHFLQERSHWAQLPALSSTISPKVQQVLIEGVCTPWDRESRFALSKMMLYFLKSFWHCFLRQDKKAWIGFGACSKIFLNRIRDNPQV